MKRDVPRGSSTMPDPNSALSSAGVNGISVALLRPLTELMGRLEIDAAEVLAALGIDDATTPETYVAGDLVDRCLDDIARRRGDPAFALTLARAAIERPVGMFGHMVWLSGTLRDALTRASKFWAMVSRRSTVSFDEGPGGIATVRQRSVNGIPHGRILTEYSFASLALLIFEGGASDNVFGVDFKAASETYQATLTSAGHFAAICDHGKGHKIPLDAAPSVATFFTANGFGVWPSPYASGLPATFPTYCAR